MQIKHRDLKTCARPSNTSICEKWKSCKEKTKRARKNIWKNEVQKLLIFDENLLIQEAQQTPGWINLKRSIPHIWNHTVQSQKQKENLESWKRKIIDHIERNCNEINIWHNFRKKVETRKCCDDIFHGLKEKQNKTKVCKLRIPYWARLFFKNGSEITHSKIYKD